MTPDKIQDGLDDRGLLDAIGNLAMAYHVTLDEITSRRRTKRIAAARHAAWSLLRTKGFSYPEIGALWNVHHATVLQACRNRDRL